jgi:hypothetical protein
VYPSPIPQFGKWVSEYYYQYNRVVVGYFDDELEAAKVRGPTYLDTKLHECLIRYYHHYVQDHVELT